MNKYLSSVMGGALLIGGMSAAQASLFVNGDDGTTIFGLGGHPFETFVQITGFDRDMDGDGDNDDDDDDGDNEFFVNLSNTTGMMSFGNASCQGNCSLTAIGGGIFDPSPLGTDPSDPLSGDAIFFPIEPNEIFTGSYDFNWAVDSIMFGAGADQSGVPTSDTDAFATLSYAGVSTLFGIAGLPPFPVDGSLTLYLTDLSEDSASFRVVETVNSGLSVEGDILGAIDSLGANPGQIDGVVSVPLPGSLALLGLGLVGLGFARRSRAG